ncbi:MAG: mRNA surveillance protein pelota [DPANN group archaeon]|nr:mRNA surveillance protein pelota [DPANN group archaeon]
MKIIHKDLKKETKIKIETIDDLWDLKNIITKNDIIGCKTIRTLQNLDKKEKRTVYLNIEVESVDFDENTESLRIGGNIINGPDDISHGHHTARLVPNDIIAIEKKWKQYEIDRLTKASKTKNFNVLITVLDEHDVDFAIASQNTIKYLGNIQGPSSGKLYSEGNKKEYYTKIVDHIETQADTVDKIIIAGPGFTKENILELTKNKPKLNGKCIGGTSSVTGKRGIYEVIHRGELDKIIIESKIYSDIQLINKILEEIKKNSGRITYGQKHIELSAESGAIEHLLVSDKIIRDEETEKIINIVEKYKGKISIIDSKQESGKILKGLGNIAALLRFKME